MLSTKGQPSIADDKSQMAKSSSSCSSSSSTTPENSVKGEKKKKSIIPKIFSSKKNGRESSEEDITQSRGNDHDLYKMTSRMKVFLEASPGGVHKNFSGRKNGTMVLDSYLIPERHSSVRIEGLNLSNFDQPMGPPTIIQDIRVFVATWNVGGKTPDTGLNLEDFLQVEGSADVYILGFQEIVPLSAGNVLVIEDNEPAARWLALISQALNKSYHDSSHSFLDGSNISKHSNNSKDFSKSSFFHKRPSLKMLCKKLKVDSSLLKVCNCHSESNRRPRKLSDPCAAPFDCGDSSIDEILQLAEIPTPKMSYRLVAKKQMVGIFLSIWARKELVQHIGHLRISCVGRGIMGCLGNKGCISISLTLHQTSFCFVCSHLASGEKEGDEVRRNADVAEILKSTQFPRICKNSYRPLPEKIIGHDRIIWLGDLNYRVSLSYEETRLLLEDNDWDSLLERDQLKIEKEAGRVFSGFSEGRILFAPTYKYSHNSDSYAGETVKSKKKRRTPAWCDRILWRGNGLDQLSYIRGESRFSDHRPVCAVFAIQVEMKNKNTARFRKGYSCTASNLGFEDCIPQRHSFYD